MTNLERGKATRQKTVAKRNRKIAAVAAAIKISVKLRCFMAPINAPRSRKFF